MEAKTQSQGTVSLLVLVILAIVSLAVAIFFIFNGIKILKVLYGTTTSLSPKRTATAKRVIDFYSIIVCHLTVSQKVSWLVGSLGVALLGVVIALILIASPARSASNGGTFGTSFHLYIWMFIVSFIVVWAFQPPRATVDSSTAAQGTTTGQRTTETGAASKNSENTSISSASSSDEKDVKLDVMDLSKSSDADDNGQKSDTEPIEAAGR